MKITETKSPIQFKVVKGYIPKYNILLVKLAGEKDLIYVNSTSKYDHIKTFGFLLPRKQEVKKNIDKEIIKIFSDLLKMPQYEELKCLYAPEDFVPEFYHITHDLRYNEQKTIWDKTPELIIRAYLDLCLLKFLTPEKLPDCLCTDFNGVEEYCNTVLIPLLKVNLLD